VSRPASRAKSGIRRDPCSDGRTTPAPRSVGSIGRVHHRSDKHPSPYASDPAPPVVVAQQTYHRRFAAASSVRVRWSPRRPRTGAASAGCGSYVEGPHVPSAAPVRNGRSRMHRAEDLLHAYAAGNSWNENSRIVRSVSVGFRSSPIDQPFATLRDPRSVRGDVGAKRTTMVADMETEQGADEPVGRDLRAVGPGWVPARLPPDGRSGPCGGSRPGGVPSVRRPPATPERARGVRFVPPPHDREPFEGRLPPPCSRAVEHRAADRRAPRGPHRSGRRRVRIDARRAALAPAAAASGDRPSYYEDLHESAIAELLRCRPATVRSLVARGLEALRALPEVTT
jgi:hypothetical protein